MDRYLSKIIEKDLSKKMVFLSGPRQSGKTTIAKRLLGDSVKSHYYNWDDDEDREKIYSRTFPSDPGVFVLDEVHKYPEWRRLLKGLYDKRGHELQILVTGSAKLDHYRRGGDSLQGRYHSFRLHPFSYKEVESTSSDPLGDLLKYGGFPEPYLERSEEETMRWSRQYRTRILRDELVDLERVREIGTLERLAIRLPECVGSPLSLNSLREDLEVTHQSVSRWVTMLENLYYLFRIYPFGSPKLRAVKKEAKHYHFDWTLCKDPAARFENLVACHLLKWCHFQEDAKGWDMELRYFRNVDKKEVDFVVMKEQQPVMFVECKSSKKDIHPALTYLSKCYPSVPCAQLSRSGDFDLTNSQGIRLCSADRFLKDLV